VGGMMIKKKTKNKTKEELLKTDDYETLLSVQ
jgi:hypothetical protein